MSRQELGRIGESLAAEHLEGLGYTIIARNHRSPLGELDLVAQFEGGWVFVEVKTRRSTRCGTGAEAVTRPKQARLIRLAQGYLAERGAGDAPLRFDVVDVFMEGGKPLIRHLPGAFGQE